MKINVKTGRKQKKIDPDEEAMDLLKKKRYASSMERIIELDSNKALANVIEGLQNRKVEEKIIEDKNEANISPINHLAGASSFDLTNATKTQYL
jgi:hypothetical protein